MHVLKTCGYVALMVTATSAAALPDKAIKRGNDGLAARDAAKFPHCAGTLLGRINTALRRK